MTTIANNIIDFRFAKMRNGKLSGEEFKLIKVLKYDIEFENVS